ncbi:hypothetical protein HSX11_11450 [Oxalobacteraceae bacterium]|nr:hypothetical protein [Oxalobacteraceae bacterium]
MIALALRALVLAELRLRLRRFGTIAAVLCLMALTWMMVADPAGGHTMVALDGARVAYTSSCLALGSALLAGLLFGIAAFYLVRGRMGEDARSGIGGVLAATPVSSAVFLFGRWLGSVAYLCLLLLAFLATMLVLHAVRGEGAIQLGVYLQTFAALMLPTVFFAASMALLCESWRPLMGKRGDVLYFLLCVLMLGSSVGTLDGRAVWTTGLLFDFSGLGSAMLALQEAVSTTNFQIGDADFDPALAPVRLPDALWSARLLWTRAACALVAMLPLLPALLLFHRFAPERIKVGAAQARWSPLALANRWLRRLAVLVQPLFALAARLPSVAGQACAELALTLAANPAAIAALLLLLLCGMLAPVSALGGVLTVAIAVWGMLVSELSVRDRLAAGSAMRLAAPGGAGRRHAAQWLAACLLALLMSAPVVLRWLFVAPLRLAALASGVALLAAAAALLGGVTRSGRAFLALFLVGLYLATQAKTVAALDVVGFNGAATPASVLTQCLLAALLYGVGFAWQHTGGETR